MIWDSNAYYLRGHRLFHNTFLKVHTQGSKDIFYFEKPKPKELRLAPSCDNIAESPKKNNRKDKKKRFQSQKREHTGEQKEKTLATSINTIDASKKKKRDVSEIIYFNYNKKGYFASNYTKSKN